jgi:hypothetical protein
MRLVEVALTTYCAVIASLRTIVTHVKKFLEFAFPQFCGKRFQLRRSIDKTAKNKGFFLATKILSLRLTTLSIARPMRRIVE